ncbi:glycosyltransferase family 4 protein [Candidatus Giovannonibacteria bacterium]|nr:glycosyltransferase family 4 protein [Candidatus Giovannonibacteria bacterium]
MKVLMISGDAGVLKPGSVVADRMVEYGNTFGELDILVLTRTKMPDAELASGTRVFSVGGRFYRFWGGYRKAKKLMQENKYDVITAQDAERSFLAWLLSRKFGIPWQMQIHTDIFSSYFVKHSASNKLRVRLAKFLIPRASGVRVVSERIKNSILGLGFKSQEHKITVLPIYLDIDKIRNAPVKMKLHEKYPSRDFIILMPSRLSAEKNIYLALEIMKTIAERFPKTLLLIVGEGPEKESLKQKVKSLKLEANIKFEDWTDDLTSYYKTADLYLLTSNYEGGARAPLEALAAGLPVLMTDVAPANEDVIDGFNGMVVPVGDARAIYQKITEVITIRERLGALKDGAKASFPSVLSKEEYLEQYKKILKDLL